MSEIGTAFSRNFSFFSRILGTCQSNRTRRPHRCRCSTIDVNLRNYLDNKYQFLDHTSNSILVISSVAVSRLLNNVLHVSDLINLSIVIITWH